MSLQSVGERAQKLGELKRHPNWSVLSDIVEGRYQKYYHSWLRQLMQGRALDQREIDYKTGFVDGARWIVKNVENAEDQFDNALRKARRLEGDE